MALGVSAKELIAIFISRHIRNGDYVSVGTNLPVPTAGVFLAHLTHAPDLRLNVLSYFTNLSHVQRVGSLAHIVDPRMAKWAEAIMSLDLLTNAIRHMDLCFAGGIQIDRYGNTNLIGVGRDPRRLKFRGPGSVGTSTVMSTVKRFFIYTNNHSPRVFVERCDYVSAVGWHHGGADARRRLGLPGGGPEYVLTPLGVFDFEEETKAMRIKHLFPGVDLDTVVRNTGFELVVPERIEPMPDPTSEELQVLRTRVDPEGSLRAEG
jgi:glutaconate CoA-transferase subunit B